VLDVLRHADPDLPGGDVDLDALLAADTLITDPPTSLTADLRPLALVNTVIDVVEALIGRPRT
jgi:hypothetical protein